MKLGIIIYSDEPETVWNVFRLGNFTLANRNAIKIFLLGQGVECESIDTDKFKITEQMQTFVNGGGEILACGTCLEIRQSNGSELCPLSTMKDLYKIVKESDKIITF